MRREWLIQILGLVFISLLLAACGESNAEPASNTAAASSSMDNMEDDAMDETVHEEMDMDQEEMAMDDMDMSTSRTSEEGLFLVSYSSDTGAVPMNELHTWTLHVETAGGQPVDDATIMVDGGMPEHGHGLPTEPEVTENLGDGDYRVEGLKFQMAGLWEVAFTIDGGGQSDTVVFHLMVAE